jgi:GNAT superfamily N-acetyltransferase
MAGITRHRLVAGPAAPRTHVGWIDQGALYVHRVEDELVGTVAIHDEAHAKYLHLLMVHRGHAGQDVGARMLDQAEALARYAGARYLRLDAGADIEPLQRWYDTRGYENVGSHTFKDGDASFTVVLRQKSL